MAFPLSALLLGFRQRFCPRKALFWNPFDQWFPVCAISMTSPDLPVTEVPPAVLGKTCYLLKLLPLVSPPTGFPSLVPCRSAHLTVVIVPISAHQVDTVTVLVPEGPLVGQGTVGDG